MPSTGFIDIAERALITFFYDRSTVQAFNEGGVASPVASACGQAHAAGKAAITIVNCSGEELGWPYGCPAAVALMVLVRLVMLYYFKKKKWF